MAFFSPLRYPGGKGKLTGFIKLLFQHNRLLDGHYVEPYAGGAGVGIALLRHDYASCVHLNDLNRSVYAFWHSVLYETESLCRLINDTPVTMEEWYQQKAIQTVADSSLLELGFSTFFLNRTNRSGIILGGVIGGKNQTGKWKLDARFNRLDLCQRIEGIALYRSRVRLYNMDAADLIRTVLPKLPKKTLVYLDPPYYQKGQELYENHYQHEDHHQIAELVKNIRQPWVVSYDETPEIMGLYKGCTTKVYGIRYSAQDRYEGAEAMFFSNGLIIPNVESPTNLKVA